MLMPKATHVLVALLLVCAGAALCPPSAKAQGTAQVTITGVPPVLPSPFVGDLRQNYNRGQYLLQFAFTGFDPFQFRFRVTLSKDGQPLIDRTSDQKLFQPGTYVYRRFSDEPSIDFNTSFSDILNGLSGRVRSSVLQAGLLPEGTYTLRVEPMVRDVVMATTIPGITTFQVIYPEPPTLATPVDETTVQQATPTFTWTPSMNIPATAQPQYQVLLVEMLPGQTPLQAIQSNQIHYQNTFANRTSFTYTPDLLRLEVGKRYAWRVVAGATLGGQSVPFNNEGLSDIRTFTYQPAGTLAYGDPQLQAPTDGATVAPTRPLEWTAPAGLSVGANSAYIWLEQRVQVTARAPGQSAAAALAQGATVLDTAVAYQPSNTYTLDAPPHRGGAGERVWQVLLVGQTPDGTLDTLATSPVETYAVTAGPARQPALAECRMTAPSDQTPAATPAPGYEGQTIRVGGFPLAVQTARGSAAQLSGRGRINVPYLGAPLAVTFTNLSVNAAGRVYAGTVTAAQDDAVTALAEGVLENATTTIEALARTHAAAIATAITRGRRMAPQLNGTQPVGLPFGIAPSGRGPMTLAVVGLQFAPTGSRAKALLHVPMPALNETLTLGAADVCLNSNGLGGSFALRLLQDRAFPAAGGKKTFRYQAAAGTGAGGAPAEGTYALWENNQLGDLSVALDIAYVRSWLVPVDAQGQDTGGQATASFTFTTDAARGLSDWMADGTLERSALAVAPDILVPETPVVYDHAAGANPQDMQFPDDYQGLTSGLWTGLYVPDATLTLPAALRTRAQPDARLSIAAAPLLIDNAGVSLSARVQDLMAFPEGDLGGWGYGIDDFVLTITKNSLADARMTGGVKMPVINDGLPYNATITQTANGTLDFTFLLGDAEGRVYNTNLWRSQLLLKEGTNISIDYANGDFTAEATLHGELGVIGQTPEVNITVPEQTLTTPELDVTVAGQTAGVGRQSLTLPEAGLRISGQTIKLAAIPFEGFTLRSRGTDRVDAGTWSKGSSDVGYNLIGGFPIKIGEITVNPGEGTSGDVSLGLAFKEVQLSLPGMEQTQMFTASTSFTLWSTITQPRPSQMAEARFDDFHLDRVRVIGGLGKILELDGTLLFFQSETASGRQNEFGKRFGDGIAGSVSATFMRQASVQAEFIFGTKDDVDYWLGNLGGFYRQGLPIGPFGQLKMFGAKGGAYYHMKPPLTWTNKAINYLPDSPPRRTGDPWPAPDPPDTGTHYQVDESIALGLRAGLTIGLTRPEVFNGDVNFEVAFNNGSTGVEQVTLNGQGYFLSKGRLRGNITQRAQTAQGTADLSLVYNIPDETFVGDFGMKYAPAAGFMEASGSAKLYINGTEDRYYFQVGDPGNQWFQFPLAGALAKLEMFLYLGNSPPARVKPIKAYCDAANFAWGRESRLCSGSFQPSPPNPNVGFLMGLGASAGFGSRFAIFYGALDAGLGATINMQEVGAATCQGTGTVPGSNGFYARGQFFAGVYGEVGIIADLPPIYTGRLPIAQLGVATELNGGIPNPTWMKGNVAGRYRVLGGLIEGDFNYEFSSGTECRLGAGQALAGLDAIQDVSPAPREDDVSVFAQPSATFALNLDQVETIEGPNGPALVRLSTDGITLYEGNTADGPVVPGTLEKRDNGSLMVFKPSEALKGRTTYTFTVNAYAEERDAAGRWISAKDDDGNRIPQGTRTVTFTTGTRPTTIQRDHVAHTYPLDKKRYYVRGTHGRNGLYFTHDGINYSYLEDMTAAERANDEIRSVYLRVRYLSVGGGTSFSTPRVSAGGGYITWDEPNIDRSTIYAVQLIRVRNLNISFQERINRLGQNLRAQEERRSLTVGGGGTASVRERKVVGTTTAVPGYKILYSYHFGTSRYNSYNEKLDDTYVVAEDYNHEDDAYRIAVTSRYEPYDQYDLFGKGNVIDPYLTLEGPSPEPTGRTTTGSYVREYVRPYISSYPRSAAYNRVDTNGRSYRGRFVFPPHPLVAWVLGDTDGYGAPPLQQSELVPGGEQFNAEWKDFTTRWELPDGAMAEHADIKSYVGAKARAKKNELMAGYSSCWTWSSYMRDLCESMQTYFRQASLSSFMSPAGRRVYDEPYSSTKGDGGFVKIVLPVTGDQKWDWFYFGR